LGAAARRTIARSAGKTLPDRLGRASQREQTEPRGANHGFGARIGAELGEDLVHVEFRGVLADAEPGRDQLVRKALGDELEHLELAGGEALGGRAGAGAARK